MDELPRFWNAIINPRAFRGKSHLYWSKVKSELWEHGFTFKVCDSPSSEKCNEIVSHLVREGETNFLVVGGDGTLNEVVNALLVSGADLNQILVGVIPSGTGNDWARTHNISRKPSDIVEMFKKGRIFSHDIGKVTIISEKDEKCRYFINIAGLGFDAEVILRIQQTGQEVHNNKFIYLKNLFRALKDNRPVKCRFIFSDHEHELPIFTIAAGICKYNGNGMKPVPMADPSDGMLDVVYVEYMKGFEFYRKLPFFLKGKHIGMKKVYHVRTKHVEIIPESTMYVETEGELVGCGKFLIENTELKLRILIP